MIVYKFYNTLIEFLGAAICFLDIFFEKTLEKADLIESLDLLASASKVAIHICNLLVLI